MSTRTVRGYQVFLKVTFELLANNEFVKLLNHVSFSKYSLLLGVPKVTQKHPSMMVNISLVHGCGSAQVRCVFKVNINSITSHETAGCIAFVISGRSLF